MKHTYKIFFLAALLCAGILRAQPAGWSYIQPIQVTENSGATVTDYQMQLTINTQTLIGAGQMLASGDDIRFGKDCQGNTLFSYWIESGINTSSTVIWVKIDTLQASATTNIYMFYGNAAAAATSAINGTFMGPHSATDSTVNTSLSGSADAQRGFRFAPTEDILVSSFGKYTSSGNPRYVTLFDNSTQAVLRQTQVAGPATQFSYTAIPAIWLTQGSQYLLEIFCPAGDDSYYFGASPTVGQHITYLDMRYCNGCTQNTFPTNSLGGMLYGYVDLWYYTKTNVSPAPTYSMTPSAPLSVNAGSDVSICINNSVLVGNTATGGVGSLTYSWSPAAGLSATNTAQVTASPAATTTYTLTVTDECMNVLTDDIVVTVNQQPVLAAVAASDSICEGQSTTLTATGTPSSTFTWEPGTFSGSVYSVTPASTTTYTVIGTDINGCIDTLTLAVAVNTLPVAAAGADVAVCPGDSVQLSGSGGVACQWSPSSGLSNSTDCAPFSSPASTMDYVLTVTDANGCTDNDTVNVALHALPTLSAAGDTLICAGDTIVLAVSGTALTYAWSPSSSLSASAGVTVNAFPSAATTYTVTGTDANGCTNTTQHTVNVNPLPTVTYTFTATYCVADGPATLSGGSPAGGTYSGTAVSGSTFSPATAGTGTFPITYSYTDGNGCSASATSSVTVNACVGIAAINGGDFFSVQPNPFDASFSILFGQQQQAAQIEVFDVTGKLIFTQTANSTQVEINTMEWASGVYYLRVRSEQQEVMQKIIKR